jgi:tetratricopeptide (TPR) repeat protein
MAVLTARERARELTGAGSAGFTPSLLDFPEPERVELAWAVKDEAVHAWTAEPPRTQRCADVLNAWARDDPHPEIVGAAAWCDGLAQLAAGRMEAALDSLDRAHRQLRAAGQHQRAAQSQIPKVIALTMLGRHDAAMASGESTLAELVASGDELNAGKVESNLGWMLLRADRYAAAAERFRRAAVRSARAGDTNSSIVADVGLAGALTWQFDFDEAVRLYERAAMRIRVRGLTTLQGLVDTNLGRLELHRGRHESALRALESALQEAERDGMPQDVAEAQRDLADAYLALNLLPEAIALYDRTIASSEVLEAPVERAWALVQRSLAYTRQGDAVAAASGLAAARQVFVQAELPVGAALAGLRQASLDLAQGQAASALQRADSAAASLRSAGVDGWAHEADVVAADALSALEDSAAARRRYDATLAAAQPFPELCAAAHTGRGQLCLRHGDAAGARADFERALYSIELQRAALPGDEFRTAYGADKQRAYDGLIELALDDAGPDAAWQLLRSIERARAPALRAALAQAPGATPGEGALDATRREQLRWLQEQWRQAVAEGEMERAGHLQARSRDLERDWLESQRRRQAARSAAGAAAPGGEALAGVDADALRAALDDDTALVCFGQVGGRLAACVATRERLARVVAPMHDLVERIRQLRFQIDSLRFGAPALRRHGAQIAQRARAHLQALHAIVWQPLAQAVQGRPRLVVVPHRSLHYLPLGALDDGTRFLLATHEIAVAPSVALWLQARAGAATAARPWRRVAVAGVGGDTLPHVAKEVDAVAYAFRSLPGGAATVLRDEEATQPALRRALDGADVLHLACHGQFRADSPYFSALHLADGPLTVRDAAGLPLRADLVTLSACETGVSRVAPGDEALGLLRGFLMGGARRVLATQWTVDDASTAALMARFYAGVTSGQRPTQALRQAQRALIEAYPHPYHWAAFTLHERC